MTQPPHPGEAGCRREQLDPGLVQGQIHETLEHEEQGLSWMQFAWGQHHGRDQLPKPLRRKHKRGLRDAAPSSQGLGASRMLG